MKPIRLAAAVLLLVCGVAPVLLAQQPAPAAPPPSTTSGSTIIQRVLVKVNGEFFTQKDLEERQADALQQASKNNLQGAALTAAVTEMLPDLLVTAVDDMLLLQKGKELGFHLSDEQFKESLDAIKKDNNLTDADLKAALQQEGLSLDTLRARLDKNYIIRTVQQREVMGKMALTEEELRQYFDKHRDEFVKPSMVMLRELLVAVPAQDARGGQPQLFGATTDSSARAKATALRERAEKGEDFEKLIAEASDSPTKATGGSIGPININEMATGIRDAIEKMQPGEITQPIRTTRGYQMFKLESRTKSEPLPFEEVKDDLAQKVGEARLSVEVDKYLTTLRAQAILEWKRSDLQQMYEKRVAEKVKQ